MHVSFPFNRPPGNGTNAPIMSLAAKLLNPQRSAAGDLNHSANFELDGKCELNSCFIFRSIPESEQRIMLLQTYECEQMR